MRVYRCPRCNQLGGSLVFRSTKQSVDRKYPYVGHYDPSKKSRKRWCSISKKNLQWVQFSEEWFSKYVKLIKSIQTEYLKKGENEETGKKIVKAAEMLEKNGFLQYEIADRVQSDFLRKYHTEQEILENVHKRVQN